MSYGVVVVTYEILPDWLSGVMDELRLDGPERDVILRLAADYDYGLMAETERNELLLTVARLGGAYQDQTAPGRALPRSLASMDFLQSTGIGRLLRPYRRQTPRYLDRRTV